jgi:hypothetical protein
MRKFIIIITIVVLATILGGCTTNHKYDGIQKENIRDLSQPEKIDFVQIYRGSTDNWAATYYIYRFKGEEDHVTRLYVKYIGNEPLPTGQLFYSYKAEGEGGHGDLPARSNSRVYNLGQGGGNGHISREDVLVSFTIMWNGKSESFELKSSK